MSNVKELFNSLEVTMVAADPDLKIIYLNEKAKKFFKLLFNQEDLVGKSLSTCHNPKQMENIRKLFLDFRDKKKELNFFTMPDEHIPGGQVKVVHIPFYKDGNLAGVVEFDFESAL